MHTVSGRHHDAQVPVPALVTAARSMPLGVRLGVVPLAALKLYDPPRHGTSQFLQMVQRFRDAQAQGHDWPEGMPRIWVAADDRLHLHDGHHRAMAALHAGFAAAPAVIYDRAPFLELERRFGISRTSYIFDVLAALDDTAAENASKGKHREQTVAGPPEYRHPPDRARTLQSFDLLELLCPHEPDVSADLLGVRPPQYVGSAEVLLDRMKPTQLCVALRSAMLVSIPSMQASAEVDFDPLRVAMRMTGPVPDLPPIDELVTHFEQTQQNLRSEYRLDQELQERVVDPDNFDRLLSDWMLALGLRSALEWMATEPVVTRRLTNTEPGHNKEWGYQIYGPYVLRQWGSLDWDRPAWQWERFASPQKARSAMKKLRQQKLKKGYVTADRPTDPDAGWRRAASRTASSMLFHAGVSTVPTWWKLTVCGLAVRGGMEEELS